MSSVDLGSFLQRVEVGGSPLDPTCLAYRMDDNEPQSNMRTTAGLGTCNCCDYFTFRDATLVLIEETRLPWQIKDLRNEFARDIRKDVEELEERERHSVSQRVLRHLRQENKLKVYGSLLVLCRLAKVVADGCRGDSPLPTHELLACLQRLGGCGRHDLLRQSPRAAVPRSP